MKPARSISVSPDPNASPDWPGKLEARGKFFFSGDDKVLLKGVTYGPFAPDALGTQFPDWDTIARDLDLITELGANTLRTFTVPPRCVLDLAASRGVRVLVGIPWAEHVCFLDSKKVTAAHPTHGARTRWRPCASHPAVAALHDRQRDPARHRPLVRRAAGRRRSFASSWAWSRRSTRTTLVGYANFPSTEYLETEFTDFLAFNVYLHREPDFRRYLSRLHTLAGDRPLVLTEFGIDSMREGADEQAATLSWQVRTALEMGAAGTCVFSFTDEWFTGGHDVADWAFGLVDRERRRKPAFRAVQRWYASDGLPAAAGVPARSPSSSARTTPSRPWRRASIRSRALRYPAFEVVVVDDGSTDRTGAIADSYEGFHVIHQENKGLCAARNVGMAAVARARSSPTPTRTAWSIPTGSTISSRRSSSRARRGRRAELAAARGLVRRRVRRASPGGPTTCCSTTRTPSTSRAATWPSEARCSRRSAASTRCTAPPGDDVDVCWRLQNRGYRIGFSPAAMVWHFRRNTVKAYIGQQRGYGKAEALLYFRHPHRFNALGYVALARADLRRRLVDPVAGAPGRSTAASIGRGLFQTLYQPPSSLLAHLPFTLEWNVVALGLLAYAIAHGGHAWLGVLPLGLTWAACLAAASARGSTRAAPASAAARSSGS